MARRSLEDKYKIRPFKDAQPTFMYNVDNTTPIYTNDEGDVWVKGKPKGTIVLPDVEVKGLNLRGKELLDKIPKEKGLENPALDPFLGAIGLAGKGVSTGLDLLFPTTPVENIVGLPANIIGGRIINKFAPKRSITTGGKLLTDNSNQSLYLPAPSSPIGFLPKPPIGYLPASKTVETPINILPSSGKPIKLGNKEYNDNRAFIAKFNKWNRRYGYPSLSTSLAENSENLDNAIKDRLLQHNTFLRGVFIDRNRPDYLNTKILLQREGIENPTDDDVLKFLATHYIQDKGGRGGRSGFADIESVRYSNNSGAIYTSNGLDQAMGYAARGGKHKKSGVFIVRRPISFEGTREDWVNNAEFNFSNSSKSSLYKAFELPYLMKYGVSPQEAKFDADKYNDIMANWRNFRSEDMGSPYRSSNIENIRYQLSLYPDDALANIRKLNLRTGTPFDFYRNRIINDMLYRERNKHNLKTKEANNYDDELRDLFNIEPEPYSDITITDIVDKMANVVNSKRFNDNVYKFYKKEEAKAIKNAKRVAITPLSKEKLQDKVIKSGVTPAKVTNNIGTSERLRTTSINKGNPFQHFIFAGEPGTQGLELVERVPYELWKDLKGSTAHKGHWYPGTSRKSKSNGGKLSLEDINR